MLTLQQKIERKKWDMYKDIRKKNTTKKQATMQTCKPVMVK